MTDDEYLENQRRVAVLMRSIPKQSRSVQLAIGIDPDAVMIHPSDLREFVRANEHNGMRWMAESPTGNTVMGLAAIASHDVKEGEPHVVVTAQRLEEWRTCSGSPSEVVDGLA